MNTNNVQYQQGLAFAKNGGARTACPYEHPQAKAMWEAGYDAAEKPVKVLGTTPAPPVVNVAPVVQTGIITPEHNVPYSDFSSLVEKK